MNAFYQVAIAAKENRLPGVSGAAQDYYASAAFYERIKFVGPAGQADQLEILLFMLRHIAVDPRDNERTRLLLTGGCACVQFWGVANPVPMLHVPVGSPGHVALTHAYELNVSGPLARGVSRVRRRRSRLIERNRQLDTVHGEFYDNLPWPTTEDFKADAEHARAQQQVLGEQSRARRAQLVDRYQTRMAALSRATCPMFESWTDLVNGIAIQVLAPPAA